MLSTLLVQCYPEGVIYCPLLSSRSVRATSRVSAMAAPSFEQAMALRPEATSDTAWKFILSNQAGTFNLHLLHNGTVRFGGVDVGGAWCMGSGLLYDRLFLFFHYQGDPTKQKYAVFKNVQSSTKIWIQADSWAAVRDVLTDVS